MYHSTKRETATRVLTQYAIYEQFLMTIDGGANQCKPPRYVILRQGTDENYSQEVIEHNEVFLTISYIDCQYVWSQPDGTTNLAIAPKFLNKY